MANVFGILTAIVLALSALVAFKNKAAYETDLAETQNQKELLAKSEDRLAKVEVVLAALPPEIQGVEDQASALTSKESAQTKVNDDLNAQIKSKSDQIAEAKTQLDDIREKTSKVGNIKELDAKMRETNSAIMELTQSISDNEATLANLTAQSTSTEAQISTTKSKFEDFAASRSLPTLNTRIRSIYPSWGFVTLVGGNNVGVVTGSTLNVVRNDTVIAQLLVSGVEATSASASIVPDSLDDGATLMVGDRVVPGLKETKPAVN
jgi:peptidoglycan hydrolase CwlO-like protein